MLGLTLSWLTLGVGVVLALQPSADAGSSPEPLRAAAERAGFVDARTTGEALPKLPPAPAAKARRTIAVHSPDKLRAAFAGLRGGDRLIVGRGTYTGQFSIQRKRLAVPAQIIFRPGAKLVGGSRASGNYVAFFVSESDNIWIRGGEFTMPEGDAVKIDSSQNIVFNGAVAHHAGDSCFLIVTNTRDNRAIWLLNVETYACGSDKGHIATCGCYPDGYWRRGTHGIYYGSTRNGYYTYGGAIVNFYGHDQTNGAILQIGNGTRGLIVTGATLVRATGDPAVFAGNALNFWGDFNENVLWVNSLVYQVNGHALSVSPGAVGPGSARHAIMYERVGKSTPFLQSSNGIPGGGLTWKADPRLGPGDVPAWRSPARGKAARAYLWRLDRVGRPRTTLTLGAFEPRPRTLPR